MMFFTFSYIPIIYTRSIAFLDQKYLKFNLIVSLRTFPLESSVLQIKATPLLLLMPHSKVIQKSEGWLAKATLRLSHWILLQFGFRAVFYCRNLQNRSENKQ